MKAPPHASTVATITINGKTVSVTEAMDVCAQEIARAAFERVSRHLDVAFAEHGRGRATPRAVRRPNPDAELTKHQAQVLELMLADVPTREIMRRLNITKGTVHTYRHTLRSKGALPPRSAR